MSRRPRRVFTREFKLDLCRRLADGELRQVHVCREHGLCRSVVERWRHEFATKDEQAFSGSPDDDSSATNGRDLRTAERRIEQLEAALGRAALEVDLLRRAVEKGGSRPRSGAS